MRMGWTLLRCTRLVSFALPPHPQRHCPQTYLTMAALRMQAVVVYLLLLRFASLVALKQQHLLLAISRLPQGTAEGLDAGALVVSVGGCGKCAHVPGLALIGMQPVRNPLLPYWSWMS